MRRYARRRIARAPPADPLRGGDGPTHTPIEAEPSPALTAAPGRSRPLPDLARGLERLPRGDLDAVLADLDLADAAGLDRRADPLRGRRPRAGGGAHRRRRRNPGPGRARRRRPGVPGQGARSSRSSSRARSATRSSASAPRTRCSASSRRSAPCSSASPSPTSAAASCTPNAAEADMHGYSVDEMLSMDARDLSPPANWMPLHAGRAARRPHVEAGARPPAQGRDVVSRCSSCPTSSATPPASPSASSPPARTSPSVGRRRRRCARARSATPSPPAAPTTASGTGTSARGAPTSRRAGRRCSATTTRRSATAIDEWFGRIHPDDRDRVQRKIEDHLHGAQPALRGRAPHAAQGRHLSLGAQPRVRQPQLPGPALPHGGSADGRHRPPRLRPAHRPAQPGPLRGAPRRRARPPSPPQGPLRRALRGPRSLQGRQRHVRPRGRRRAAGRGGATAGSRGASRGHGGPLRRRRVRDPARAHPSTWRTPPAWPTASIARWPPRCSSASTRRCPPPAWGWR